MKNMITAVLLAMLLISACDSDGVSNNELRKLEKAKDKWQKNKTVNYSFNYRQSCFCAYIEEIRVVVFDDTVYAFKNPETGEDATIELEGGDVKLIDVYPNYAVTIDELFNILENAASKAYKMDGKYDPDRGFPVQVGIDYYKNGADDEINYFLSSYQVLTLTKD